MAKGAFSIAINGLRALDGIAKKVGDVANEGVQEAAIQAAARLADRIIENAPEVTGDLKSRIESGGFKKRTGKPSAAYVRVGSKGEGPTNLGALVEFGTVRAAPKLFFRPAVDANASQIIDALKRGAANGLKQL